MLAEVRSRTERHLEQLRQLRPGRELVRADQLEAARRAHVHTAAAEDASIGIEYRVDAAVKTAARLALGQGRVEATLHLALRVREALRNAQDRDGNAPLLLVVLLAPVAL